MYSVLLIDDEPWALLSLKNSVCWQDFSITQILTAEDAHTALRLMTEVCPDVVISDICMPEMSGLQLLEYVSSHGIGSSFIFVTGFSEFDYAKQAINHGAFNYLLKPIDKAELAATLDRLIPELQRRHKVKELLGTAAAEAGKYPNKSFGEMAGYVDMHFRDDLTLSQLSDRFHLNRTYISDLFRKHTGKSFSQYLNDTRLRYACDLLEMSPLTIQEIAIQAGYRDYTSFIRAFKKSTGTTPAKYRSAK